MILRFAILQDNFQQTNKTEINYIIDNHIKFEVSLHFLEIWPTVRRKRFSFHPLTFTTLWSNNDRISKNCRKKECRNKSVFCPYIKYKDSVNVFVLCLVVTQKISSKCITSKIGLCVKFIYSEKATQFCEISTVDLTAST